MARTVGDVVGRCRGILQDRDAAHYRYSDSDLVGFLNDALLEIYRVRPDLYFSDFAVTQFVEADVDDTAKTLPIDDRYFSPVVYFVVGSAELRDDEFTVDGRAVTLMNQFSSKLLGLS